MPSNISVAVATYNGEKYLAAQLQSIASQTILASEVVIFDDASEGDIQKLVKRVPFRAQTETFTYRQASNVGVISNLESAVRATSGEYIVLSDQDDIWYPHKLEAIANAFEQDPGIGLVFSDADLVDADLQTLGRSLWQSIRFSVAEQTQICTPQAFDLLLRRFLVTGATVAFRRSLLDLLLPFSSHLIHDAWIALVASAVSRIAIIDEPLIQYRQHAGQQIGERKSWRNWLTQCQAAKKMSPNYFYEQRLFFRDLASRLDKAKASWVHPNVGDLAMRKILHLDHRIAIRAGSPRSIAKIVREYAAGEYSTFSYGWKSAAQDIFL